MEGVALGEPKHWDCAPVGASLKGAVRPGPARDDADTIQEMILEGPVLPIPHRDGVKPVRPGHQRS